MPNFEEIPVESFGLGLVTNVSAADADKTSFRQFKNFQATIPGIGSALPGSGTAQLRVEGTLTNVPVLPSGFTLEGDPFLFHTTTPGTGSDAIIIFGSKSGRDRFYVWPDITTAGAWSTNTGSRVSGAYISWKELTEAVTTTIASVSVTGSGGDTFVLTSVADLETAVNDYYKHFYILVFDSANSLRSSSYIKAYTASTREVQTNFGVTGITATDKVIISRFPIFSEVTSGSPPALTPYYQIDSLPSFARHGEYAVIHTGTHSINNGPDLWLGYIDRTFFGSATGASNVDFKGWHFDYAHPFPPFAASLFSSVTVSGGSTDPFPFTSGTERYIIEATALYDGVEESRIFYDRDNQPTLSFSITAADQQISFNVQLTYFGEIAHQSDYVAVANDPLSWSRRITKIRVYIAPAEVAGSFIRPTASYFLVKELDIDDAAWTLSTLVYQLAVTIVGSDYKAGQAFPFESVNGYEGTKVGANGNFEVQVAGRNFLAPIFDDTKKLYRCLFTPIRQSGETAPDVFPITSRMDVLHSGIVEVVALAEQSGKLIILGRDKLIVGTVSGANAGTLEETFHKVGCIAARTVKNLENLVFFSSQEKMFEIFDGNRLAEESPAERIQDIWNALTAAEKEAAFAGVHRDRREYWIAFSDGGVQRIFAYSLKYGIIFEYDSSSTYIGFAEGVDGQLYGATASSIVELVSGSPTESLAITLESQIFNHDPAHYRRARVAYLSPSALTLTMIDDDEISTLREKDALLYLAQSNVTEVDRAISLNTSRAAWKLTRSTTTDTTLQIDSIVLARTNKINR